MTRFTTTTAATLILVTAILRTAMADPVAVSVVKNEPVDFNRDIRPLLSDRCFRCHGPDPEARKADLRLDTEEGAFADRGGYAAFRAGDLEKSEAIRRLDSGDPDERMPPPDSNLVLTPDEKKRMRRWILEGASWAEHWAFVPPTKSDPPAIDPEPDHVPRNPIDRFVFKRLEDAGMRPMPEANRSTLIRRVTLDLTGLPPTLDEIDAFLTDTDVGAYEKLVDRLLGSPAYGERMAWTWLDAARYADTDGFQGDPTRTMWPWRDWLVNALNENMPFDQFTVEMLAGDLLPGATPDQILATGFNRNHMHNGEGGRIPEETRVENVFDRAETTATVWLGLTMTCARCHDHKFDPITQKEYYRLYAFFNNTSETGRGGGGKAPPILQYVPPEARVRLAEIDRLIQDTRDRMAGPLPDADSRQKAWEREYAGRVAAAKPTGPLTWNSWSVLGPFPPPDGNAARSFENDFPPESDGPDLTRSYLDGTLVWREETALVDGTVHRLSDSIGATYLFRTVRAPVAVAVQASLGSDDAIKVWLNGTPVFQNNTARGAAPDQDRARLDLNQGENTILLKIVNTGGQSGFYFNPAEELVAGLPVRIADILRQDDAARTEENVATLRDYFRRNHSETWQALKTRLDALETEKNRTAAVPVMVMDELPSDQRRSTRILTRGIYSQPGDVVEEGTPAFLPSLDKSTPRNRLALARWLVSPENPLTARVAVNRYWQLFFGTGLVKSSEDFGRQGDQPSHPLLLDWLACRFIESGWNVKAMHKQMVMSAIYRQSSVLPGNARPNRANSPSDFMPRVDTDNRLWSRGPRYRMPSWMLRDQALALGGLLVDHLGGPPVKPYQPAGVWAEATFGKIRYRPDPGSAPYRRSLYIFWRRIVGPTMFFDTGKRQSCEVKSSRTNTPLHALTTLNEFTFVEASRAMAERVMHAHAASVEDRIILAFRMATARQPDPGEIQVLLDRWKATRAEWARRPDDAVQLLSVGRSARDETLDPAEHAAFTILCSTLMNLDETITRE